MEQGPPSIMESIVDYQNKMFLRLDKALEGRRIDMAYDREKKEYEQDAMMNLVNTEGQEFLDRVQKVIGCDRKEALSWARRWVEWEG